MKNKYKFLLIALVVLIVIGLTFKRIQKPAAAPKPAAVCGKATNP
jgi:uncharacterized membrane-anchored protein YhcB (DUF1043 family)